MAHLVLHLACAVVAMAGPLDARSSIRFPSSLFCSSGLSPHRAGGLTSKSGRMEEGGLSEYLRRVFWETREEYLTVLVEKLLKRGQGGP